MMHPQDNTHTIIRIAAAAMVALLVVLVIAAVVLK